MAALTNQVAKADVVAALDIEFNNNFDQSVNDLASLLGIFGVEVMRAGQAMYQYKVTGALSTATVAEGDETPLSHYKLEKVPIGEITSEPFRKVVTKDAIQKGGFKNAVLRTDRQMAKDMRALVRGRFFDFLQNGELRSLGANLQGAFAYCDADLRDALERNDDSAERIIHFVNRQDVAAYLAGAAITTQTVFGMDYLENFLGVRDVFVTSRVEKGYIYATPVDNIHLYACDFGALAEGGLSYTTSELGVVGIHHEPNYARNVVETQALLSFAMLPEVVDYISKTRIGKPMGDMSVDELKALAEAEGVDITGKTTKDAITEALTGAGVR